MVSEQRPPDADDPGPHHQVASGSTPFEPSLTLPPSPPPPPPVPSWQPPLRRGAAPPTPSWVPATPPWTPTALPWATGTPPWPLGAAHPGGWSEPATPLQPLRTVPGESPLAHALAEAATQLVPPLNMPPPAQGAVDDEGEHDDHPNVQEPFNEWKMLPPRPRLFSLVSETEVLRTRSRGRRARVIAEVRALRTSRVARREAQTLQEVKAQQNADVDADVHRFLEAIGFAQYSELFRRKRVAGEMLHTLSNVELRDDLGIHNLRHRREILRAIALYQAQLKKRTLVPEFGRILLHLSNVLVFHSWVSLGFQHIAFGVALVRLSTFRHVPPVIGSSIYVAVFGIAAIFYGAGRYLMVQGIIEDEARKDIKEFSADERGTLCAAAGALVTCALVLYLIFARRSAIYVNDVQ